MPHTLYKALKENKPAYGAWLTINSTQTARQLALAGRSAGLNWMAVDCEHGQFQLVPNAAEVVGAVAALPPSLGDPADVENPSVLVRISAPGVEYSGASTQHQINQALDSGAHGVIVPLVSNAKIAKQVAEDARFPPFGRRGCGSPYAHQPWGLNFGQYLNGKANEEILVCVQIENQEGVDNVEEIAATEGIDILLIGPFDLSMGIGYPAPAPDCHPEVEKVITRIKNAAHKYGKKAAFFCTSGEGAKRRIDEGFDMVTVQTDVWCLTEGLVKNLAAANGRIAKARP